MVYKDSAPWFEAQKGMVGLHGGLPASKYSPDSVLSAESQRLSIHRSQLLTPQSFRSWITPPLRTTKCHASPGLPESSLVGFYNFAFMDCFNTKSEKLLLDFGCFILRSDWPGLCLFWCYEHSCVVSQQSWFLAFFFLLHTFSNFTPPPPQIPCGLPVESLQVQMISFPFWCMFWSKQTPHDCSLMSSTGGGYLF